MSVLNQDGDAPLLASTPQTADGSHRSDARSHQDFAPFAHSQPFVGSQFDPAGSHPKVAPTNEDTAARTESHRIPAGRQTPIAPVRVMPVGPDAEPNDPCREPAVACPHPVLDSAGSAESQDSPAMSHERDASALPDVSATVSSVGSAMNAVTEIHLMPAYYPTLLTVYADTYESVQKLRMAQMNRLRCWLRDTLPREQWGSVDFSDEKLNDRTLYEALPNDQRDFVDRLRQFEKDAGRYLTREIARHPLWPWLKSVRGMGPVLGGRLLARVDLDRFPAPENLWSYCGLDGPNWRRKTEEGKLTYSWKLHTLSMQIAMSFEKQSRGSGGYRDIYDWRKSYEQTKPSCGRGACADRDVCTPKHIQYRAQRYTVKRFLADLWTEHRRNGEEHAA